MIMRQWHKIISITAQLAHLSAPCAVTEGVDCRFQVLQKTLLYLASGHPLTKSFYYIWDCCTDPLTPDLHKEFSSLRHSGELWRAVPLGRVFLLLVFVGEPTCSGTCSVCRRGPSSRLVIPCKSCRVVACYCLAISTFGSRKRIGPSAERCFGTSRTQTLYLRGGLIGLTVSRATRT